jgi:iron complex transport system substrate-binding protein
MKRALSFLISFCVLITLSACGTHENLNDGTKITDVFSNTSVLDKNSRVISLYASFAECWLLSGGMLVGVTEDAVTEHNLSVGDAETVGTVKHVNLEKVVALNPDYVILSADLTAHLSLKQSLDSMGIAYGFFKVDDFSQYKSLMWQFCSINNRNDLFEKNVTDVEIEIENIKSKIPKTDKNVLLIRAFSTGMKAKNDETTAGQILSEFGLKNIADEYGSLLEDLSLEEIVKTDPDYIFATAMGNEEGAMKYLENNVSGHSVWSTLTAVKNKNYYLLPKELFHFKPNNRWSESYEYLAKIIWPDIFGE